MISRRSLIVGLAGSPMAGRLALAQQGTVPVIGFLGSATPQEWTERIKAFRQGLAEMGFVEGRNVAVEYRWAEGRNEKLRALAAELAQKKVDVIAVLGNTQSTMAAKAATSTIPIVMRVAVDPVAAGLVSNLGRPGGNITGVTTLGVDLAAKHLELMRELLPGASRLALLVNPTNPVISKTLVETMPAAARKLNLDLRIISASATDGLKKVFAEIADVQPAGLVIGADTFFNSRNDEIASLAFAARLPAVSPYREFAGAGGLMSYGGSVAAATQQAGVYVGRILKGEKAGDLPVVQAAKIELVVNIKTAAAIGAAIPALLLAQADEVIE
ncbi:MAG: ABC transporter substrate-binding protein [Beijerinckiaceae bacterium]|nr:ABC transporter substrate-binding protein [Beijerinckiaceae bacterium]